MAESAQSLSQLGTDCTDSGLEDLQEALEKHRKLQSGESQIRLLAQRAQERALQLKDRTVCLVKQPEFKTYTLSTAGGAVTFSAAGGAFGLASGVVVGAGVGVLPALFTFGLSIPVGATVGGAVGMCVGTGSGALVGGATGLGACRYRVQIKDGVLYIKRKVTDTAEASKAKASSSISAATQTTVACSKACKTKVGLAVEDTKVCLTAKGKALKNFTEKKCTQAVALGKDPSFQVTSASAAAGGVVGSGVGGCTGLVTGAAAGLVPALFTFGLSIPVGATIGLCAGAVGGGTVGAVGGGAAGYGGYTHRQQISNGAQKTWQTTCSSVEYVKTKAADSAAQVKNSVKSLVGGGTGGTA